MGGYSDQRLGLLTTFLPHEYVLLREIRGDSGTSTAATVVPGLLSDGHFLPN